MLSGFNHNIRYRDRMFHVQTEDHGLKHATVVTQVFLDGRIVHLERSSYRDVLETSNSAGSDDIRHRMQQQHKEQLRRLVSGAFDAQISQYLAPSDPPSGPSEKAATVPPPGAPAPLPEVSSAFLDALDQEMERQKPLAPTLPAVSRPSEATAPRPPDATASRAPEATVSRPPEVSASRAPEATAPRPPEVTAPRPPEVTVSRAPEATASRAPETAPPPPKTPLDRAPTDTRKPAFAQSRAQARSPSRARKGSRAHGPPPADTLVDFGIPGSLREVLRARLRSPSRTKSPLPAGAAPIPAARGIVPPLPPSEPPEESVPAVRARVHETMLEIDAGALKREIETQREQLRAIQRRAEQTSDDAKKVGVVERTMDAALLSYLAEED